MNATANTNKGFKDYALGVTVSDKWNRPWKIVDVETRRSARGYQVREFILEDSAGRRCRKTSRGITLFSKGRPVTYHTSPVAVVAEPPKPEPLPELAKFPAGKLRHANYEPLLRAVSKRENVWLVGPAGTGKSTAAANVAEDLDLPFYPISFGAQTSEAKLLGYKDATGTVVRTPLREAFEHGGVALFDEIDAASPGVLVVLNSCLANDVVGFPDGAVKKHPDFVAIAGANTTGQGANRQYVGRQQIDTATLDRFVYLDWDTDPVLIAAKAGLPLSALDGLAKPRSARLERSPSPERIESLAAQFATECVRIINAIEAFGGTLRVHVGNRAILHGTDLIRAGFTKEAALDAAVWKGLDRDTRKKIELAAS